MKKILLASTILVGTAGVAAADISFSGSGFMGVTSSDGGSTWFAKNSADLSVAMSGETDGGLMFGVDATVFNWEQTANATATSHTYTGSPDDDSLSVWISGDFGKVSLDSHPHSTPGDMSLTYSNTFDAFTVDVAYRIGPSSGGQTFDVELGYTFGDYSVYLGHDTNTSNTRLGGEGTFGDFTVSVDLVNDVPNTELDWTVGVDWSSGAISLGAALDYDVSSNGGNDYKTTLSASYDLGGGASVDFDYKDPSGGAPGDETITLGVSMDF